MSIRVIVICVIIISYTMLSGVLQGLISAKKYLPQMSKTNKKVIGTKKNYVINEWSGKDIPVMQRALVLQGGGTLGAYGVGVLKVLCDTLSREQGKDGIEGPLIDIIAGTSMGAMNAAVLVSNVVNRNKTWKEAVDQLEIFWTNEEKGLSSTPDYSKWWWND